MDLFNRLRSSKEVTMLCGATVGIGPLKGDKRSYSFEPAELDREAGMADYVLLAMHYYSHILARYPREDGDLDKYGIELREAMSHIVEEGIWPGSDLMRYAQVDDRACFAQPGELKGASEVGAVLFRAMMGEDLDLALEIPENLDNPELVLSVPAVFQGMMGILDEPALELLDKALRYYRTYIGEGANYASPAAAKNLANRAFREAGGEIA